MTGGDKIVKIFAYWVIVYIKQFFDNYKSSSTFGVLFAPKKMMCFDQIGQHFGRFFRNSSCHPVNNSKTTTPVFFSVLPEAIQKHFYIRVARFFLGHDTKTRKNIPKNCDHNIDPWSHCLFFSNCRYQFKELLPSLWER
jgi:hypothetical protein